MKKISLWIIVAGFALQSAAAQQPQQDLREYVVELIVFRNLDAAYTQEIFPKRDAFGDTVSAYEFLDGEIQEDQQDQLGPTPGNFRRTPKSYYKLSDAVRRLQKSSRYEPVLHMSWIQPGFGRDDAKFSELNTNRGSESLNGTAILTVSNYLHLDVDIVLEGGDQTLYRLREKRKMRRNETHYFDHPHLGMLAVVTRLSEFESQEPAKTGAN